MNKSIKKVVSSILFASILIASIPVNSHASNNIRIDRVAGNNRYVTNAQISKRGLSNADTVLITSGDNFADALTAGALAGQVNGSLLLTNSKFLPGEIKGEINRLNAKKAYIIGGESSVSTNVAKSTGLSYTRLGGKNRYDASELVAKEVINQGGNKDKIVLASGNDFPDSLAGGAYVASNNLPIMLAYKTMPEFAKDKEVILIGGKNNIDVDKDLPMWSGNNRYTTALEVAKNGYGNFDKVILTNGENYADALSASILSKQSNAPLFLTSKNVLDKYVENYIKENATEVIAIGGENSVSTNIIKTIKDEVTEVEKPNIEKSLRNMSKSEVISVYNNQKLLDASQDLAVKAMNTPEKKLIFRDTKVISGNEMIVKLSDGTYRKLILGAVKNPNNKIVFINGFNYNGAEEYLRHIVEGGVNKSKPNPAREVIALGISSVNGKDISALVKTSDSDFLGIMLIKFGLAEFNTAYNFVAIGNKSADAFRRQYENIIEIPNYGPGYTGNRPNYSGRR